MTVMEEMSNGYIFPAGYLGRPFRIRIMCRGIEENLTRHLFWVKMGNKSRPSYAKFFNTRYTNLTIKMKEYLEEFVIWSSAIILDPLTPDVVKEYSANLLDHTVYRAKIVDDLWGELAKAKNKMGW